MRTQTLPGFDPTVAHTLDMWRIYLTKSLDMQPGSMAYSNYIQRLRDRGLIL